MKIKSVVSDLESTKEFSRWRTKDKKSFLAHLFIVVDKEHIQWHVGYCDKKDRITTFDIKDKIKMHPREQAFKKPDSVIKKLDLITVKIDIAELLERMHRIQQEKYSAELPVRKIVILQQQEQGPAYVVTYVTTGLKTLTLVVDATTGEVRDEKLQQLFTFDQPITKLT